MKYRFFSLIEAMIVTGCLFLLLVLGGGMVKDAQGVKCQSSLARLHEAVTAYTFDYNEYLPQSVNYSYEKTLGPLAQHWLVNLNYVPKEVMRDGCPQYPKKPKAYNLCGYGYNAYLGRYDKAGVFRDVNPMWYRNFPAVKSSAIKNPGQKFLMGDVVNYPWLAYISNSNHNDWRHDGGSNFLYFDGQVKHHPKSDFQFNAAKWDHYDINEIRSRLWPQ